MAAKLSPRVEDVLEQAASLGDDERAALVEALRLLPRRPQTPASERAKVMAARVAQVENGKAASLALDEVEARYFATLPR